LCVSISPLAAAALLLLGASRVRRRRRRTESLIIVDVVLIIIGEGGGRDPQGSKERHAKPRSWMNLSAIKSLELMSHACDPDRRGRETNRLGGQTQNLGLVPDDRQHTHTRSLFFLASFFLSFFIYEPPPHTTQLKNQNAVGNKRHAIDK
jgi:hypothetical protein